MIIGGSEQMAVWDDLQPSQRLSLYDTGVDLTETTLDHQHQVQVAYRTGTIVAPALREAEALSGVVDEFVQSIRQSRAPATDGHAGLRVLEMLEAARASLHRGGELTAAGASLARSAA
jgi:predicted dehydrogenase